MIQPPNGISISSTVFAHLIHVPNTKTGRQAGYATCDICSNRQHLMTIWCSLTA